MSNRKVLVYWNSNTDAQDDADEYCRCVRDAATCEISCRTVESANDPNTIRVTGIVDGNVQWSRQSPTYSTVRQLVEQMCAS